MAEIDDEPLLDLTPATSPFVQILETVRRVWDLDNRYAPNARKPSEYRFRQTRETSTHFWLPDGLELVRPLSHHHPGDRQPRWAGLRSYTGGSKAEARQTGNLAYSSALWSDVEPSLTRGSCKRSW